MGLFLVIVLIGILLGVLGAAVVLGIGGVVYFLLNFFVYLPESFFDYVAKASLTCGGLVVLMWLGFLLLPLRKWLQDEEYEYKEDEEQL